MVGVSWLYFNGIPMLKPSIIIQAIINGIRLFLKSNLASDPILSSVFTNKFIIRILIIIPCSRGIMYLNIMVSIPRNRPYSICPIGVRGLVLGSVVMNMALNIKPHDRICRMGYHILVPPITYVMANTVRIYVMGIFHFITLKYVRYINDIIHRNTLVSPIVPGMVPMKKFSSPPYGFTIVSYVPVVLM